MFAFFNCVHIRCCGNGRFWFRSYSGLLGKAPSNQGLLPLTLGASLWLGMPSLRSCSVGPPPSAIHGRRRLTRHPCRVAHYAEPERSLTRGRTPQQRPRRPTGRPACWLGSARFRSAGRLAPTVFASNTNYSNSTKPVGASLLAMRPVHPTSMLTGRPPSRASSLPQKSRDRALYTFALHHSSGRALARLQLLILIHPPPRKAEWRRSSGG